MKSILLESKKHYISVKIESNTPLKTIKLLASLNIKMFEINYASNFIYLKIFSSDYDKVSKYFKTEKLSDYGIFNIKKILKDNIISLYILVLSLGLIYLFTQVIVNVYVIHSNSKIRELISDEADELGIKKYTFKKDFDELNKIKIKILNKYKDKLEWIEIINTGMVYRIKVQDKIITDIDTDNSYCDIVAGKDAIIRRIIASKGDILLKTNNYVRKGDKIISGDIIFNETTKNLLCASGKVYGETWYTVDIKMPKTKLIKEYTGKSRYNFMIRKDLNDYKILKSRISNFDDDNKLLFRIFDYEVFLQKEREYKSNYIKIEENELIKNIDKEVNNKLKVMLKDDFKILDKKVLKKSINDSTIYIETFVTVEEQIGVKQKFIKEVKGDE